MCETNAYLLTDGQEKLIMENVDTLKPEKGGVIYLQDIFGVQHTIKGRIKEMSLSDHKIILEQA